MHLSFCLKHLCLWWNIMEIYRKVSDSKQWILSVAQLLVQQWIYTCNCWIARFLWLAVLRKKLLENRSIPFHSCFRKLDSVYSILAQFVYNKMYSVIRVSWYYTSSGRETYNIAQYIMAYQIINYFEYVKWLDKCIYEQCLY